MHPGGMRKVLAKTEMVEGERQAVDVLLGMVRRDVRRKLFAGGDV